MRVFANLDTRELIEGKPFYNSDLGAGDQAELGQIAELHRISIGNADDGRRGSIGKL